jgi:2,3-bisphosphoglycerate-independent phosphoglycerate mutase
MAKKVLFIILDGMPDGFKEGRPSALEKAHKPFLDFITANGFAGMIDNRLSEGPGLGPDSGVSHWQLLGYSDEPYPGRGYLDALGAGLEVKPTDIAIRANFATVKEEPDPTDDVVPLGHKTQGFPFLNVVDRRAGREYEGLAEISKDIRELSYDGMKVKFFRSTCHRGVVLISSVCASEKITNSDPGMNGIPVHEIRPLSSDNNAVSTAVALNKWEMETHKIMSGHTANKYRKMPANFLLLRDPGKYVYVKSFKEMFGMKGACVAASPVVRGICRAMGMDLLDARGATADVNTNLSEKVLTALRAMDDYSFVLLHVLATDVISHDGNFNRKQGYIDKIDREIFERIREYFDFKKSILVVTSDHICSVYSGVHEQGFVPFVICTKDITPNGVEKFDEKSCRAGPVADISEFMEILMSKV